MVREGAGVIQTGLSWAIPDKMEYYYDDPRDFSKGERTD